MGYYKKNHIGFFSNASDIQIDQLRVDTRHILGTRQPTKLGKKCQTKSATRRNIQPKAFKVSTSELASKFGMINTIFPYQMPN